LKRFYIILFYAALLVFRSVAYPGFTTNLLDFKEQLLNGYILRHSNRSFALLSQTLTIYLKSQADLVSNFVTDYQWFEKLSRDGVISGAYVREGITSFTLGSPFIPEFMAESQFYVDKDGSIHYVFSDTENEVFVDAIINCSELQYDLKKISRNPEWLLLYDELTGNYSILFQRDEEGEIDFESLKHIAFSPMVLELRSVLYTRSLSIENSTFVLIARYPLMLSEYSVDLFGLIVIVLLTILLLIFIIRFVISITKRGMGKRVPVEERKKGVDIVNQIEGVLFSVKDASQIREKKRATPKPSGRSDQLLVHDGIHIKKP